MRGAAPTGHSSRMQGDIGRKIVVTVFAASVSIAFLVPVLWLLGGALRPGDEIFRSLSPLSLNSFISSKPTLSNFADVLSGPFRRGLINSLIVTIATVIGSLSVCTLAAFAFSAMPLPKRDLLFGVVIFTFLIPGEVIALPLARLFGDWGLQNTYAGLVLPGLGDGVSIFLLRQFFLGIPRQLVDAARTDGAGWFAILHHIYLPLSRPALIAAGLLVFNSQWQAYLWPLLVTTQQDMFLAPIVLAQLFGQYDSDFGQIFAGSTILSVIPAAILLMFQGYFTQSVATSGIRD